MALYVDHISQPSRAVMLFTQLSKLPTKTILVRIARGETRTAEFQFLNPLQQVPVFKDDDGFRVWDSAAIFRYLGAKLPVSDANSAWLGFANSSPRTAAAVDEALAFYSSTLRPAAAPFVFGKVLGPLGGLPVKQSIVEAAEAKLPRTLKQLNGFLAESELTAADVVDGSNPGGSADDESILASHTKAFGSGAFVACGFANLSLPMPLDGTPAGRTPMDMCPWIPSLCGAPSVADLVIACELEQLLVLPEAIDMLEAYPEIVRYMQRMRAGFDGWDDGKESHWSDVHRLLYKVVEKVQKRPAQDIIQELNERV